MRTETSDGWFEQWWAALQHAFNPHPQPQTPAAWSAWADGVDYQADVAPAGPQGTEAHHRLYELLRWGMCHFGEMSRWGRQLGRDFVIRLGEHGLTPDLVFIDRERLAHLDDRYLEGPPAIAIELVMTGSAAQDRTLKRQLYEQGGVPEYWLIDPECGHSTFYRLQPSGRYASLVLEARDVQRLLETNQDYLYRSEAVPGLSLSMRQLWSMAAHDRQDRWAHFVPVAPHPEPLPSHRARDDGIAWDSIPFAPRVALEPTPIRFAEYASWCGRAKFEWYGGGLKIDGSEGTRRVAGMLLLTFGLVEVVKLAQPRTWVTLLDRGTYRTAVEYHTRRLMRQAQYRPLVQHQDGKTTYHGAIPGLPDLSGFGETIEACAHDLTHPVQAWVLRRIARREPLPAS
ncbi:MAG: Uma2 family endonuclease [Candidatus Entotheonellia bacterium]